jgi:CheY-like chemotaxis protein
MYKFTGVKILVVDDEELLREILVETFSMYGAIVDSAEGGNVAFDKIQKNHYDMVISDVRMPNGDGISLMARIKDMGSEGLNKNLKLFVCSAYNDLTAEKIKELNILKIFNKPFDIENLLTQISAFF